MLGGGVAGVRLLPSTRRQGGRRLGVI